MSIPIENIYFLLCYSWNTLDEKDKININTNDQTELINLFAKVLINVTKILLKRGIDKNYIDESDEITGIKGKLMISQTLKSNLLTKQRTICTFSDFTSNILANRILVTTLYIIIRTKGIDPSLKQEILNLLRKLHDIDLIKINKSLFSNIKYHQNNRIYRFIMNICQIVYENTLPSEQPGKYQFTDFTRDDKKMNKLFESFIRNFYKIEQNKYKVKPEIIKWQFESNEVISKQFLPQMETDITLINNTQKIIIDAKYYKETMTKRYEQEKINSHNLYQIFSYLINQEDGTEISTNTTGMLLYPTIDKEYNLDFTFRTHKIQIRTVNLNTDWRSISERLKEIIDV